jgi:hypothetical protein
MTGRTLSRFERVYVDGYDLSGYGRSIGPLGVEFAVIDLTAPMSDAMKGYLLGMPSITVGTFNGVMQSSTDVGTEISVIQSAGSAHDIMVAIGDRAAPAIGVPVFCAKSAHSGFHVVEEGGAITVTAEFADVDASDIGDYNDPWGVLLHTKLATTAANTGTGDSVLSPRGTTSLGGYMMYQIFSGDMTGKISVEHSDDNVNANFVGVGGLEYTLGSFPAAGIIQTTAKTTAINQWTRWQLTIGSGTTLTFALALVRGK